MQGVWCACGVCSLLYGVWCMVVVVVVIVVAVARPRPRPRPRHTALDLALDGP